MTVEFIKEQHDTLHHYPAEDGYEDETEEEDADENGFLWEYVDACSFCREEMKEWDKQWTKP